MSIYHVKYGSHLASMIHGLTKVRSARLCVFIRCHVWYFK